MLDSHHLDNVFQFPVNNNKTIDTDTLSSPKDYQTAINAAWQKSTLAILGTAHLLRQAQEHLDHDVFSALRLPFGKRTKERLIAIARHPVIGAATHVSQLPPHWGTLYALTKVPDEDLLQALKDGRIDLAMERKEVSALLPKLKTESVTNGPNATAVSLEKAWDATDAHAHRVFLDGLGRADLCAAMSPALIADFAAHVVGLQIASAASAQCEVQLTQWLRTAIATGSKPERAAAVARIAAKLVKHGRCAGDLVVTYTKKKRRIRAA